VKKFRQEGVQLSSQAGCLNRLEAGVTEVGEAKGKASLLRGFEMHQVVIGFLPVAHGRIIALGRPDCRKG
jgi:hypothetical protein